MTIQPAVRGAIKHFSKSDVVWLVLICSFILGTIWHLVVSVYARTDDYVALHYHARGMLDWWDNVFSRHGRVLLGPLLKAGFEHAGDLNGFRLLRAVSVTGLVVLAWVVYGWMRLQLVWRSVAAVAALGVALNPATIVYAGWTVCYPYSWVLLLAFIAGICAIRVGRCESVFRRVLTGGITCCNLWMCMLVYQPAVAMFFLPILLRYASNPRLERKVALMDWLAVLLCFFLTAAVYLLFYKWYAHEFFSQASDINRSAVDLNPVGWASRFGSFTWQLSTFWEHITGGVWAWLTAGIIIILLLLSGSWKWFLLGLPFMLTPVLWMHEEVVAYRTIPGGYAWVACMVSVGLSQLHRRYGGSRLFTIIVLLLIPALYITVQASRFGRSGIVETSVGEWQRLVSEMESWEEVPERLWYVLPTESRHIGPSWIPDRMVNREYGELASQMPVNARPLLVRALSEAFKMKPSVVNASIGEIRFFRPWDPVIEGLSEGQHPHGIRILDGHKLLIGK